MSTVQKVVTVCGIVMCTACSTTTMRTARQLEAGDVVLSGGLDEPGFVYVPRASAQLMYGLGVGDVSVHAGTTIATYNAGLGGRFYLGESWTAALQADANGLLRGSSEVDFGGLYAGTLQITTAARSQRALYGGFHLAVQTSSDADEGFAAPVLNAGLLGGVDILLADNLGLQLEARVSPLVASAASGFGVFPITDRIVDDSPAGLFAGQLGIALYKRWSVAPSIQGSVEEDRWNDPSDDFSSDSQ